MSDRRRHAENQIGVARIRKIVFEFVERAFAVQYFVLLSAGIVGGQAAWWRWIAVICKPAGQSLNVGPYTIQIGGSWHSVYLTVSVTIANGYGKNNFLRHNRPLFECHKVNTNVTGQHRATSLWVVTAPV